MFDWMFLILWNLSAGRCNYQLRILQVHLHLVLLHLVEHDLWVFKTMSYVEVRVDDVEPVAEFLLRDLIWQLQHRNLLLIDTTSPGVCAQGLAPRSRLHSSSSAESSQAISLEALGSVRHLLPDRQDAGSPP